VALYSTPRKLFFICPNYEGYGMTVLEALSKEPRSWPAIGEESRAVAARRGLWTPTSRTRCRARLERVLQKGSESARPPAARIEHARELTWEQAAERVERLYQGIPRRNG